MVCIEREVFHLISISTGISLNLLQLNFSIRSVQNSSNFDNVIHVLSIILISSSVKFMNMWPKKSSIPLIKI